MKYSVEIRAVEIPGRPKFFRATMRDESITDAVIMALDNDSLSDLARDMAIAISNRESGKK